eukprot:scaffold574182_cov16-Prasinocladus_malaysianus.AAC.1
MKEDKHGIMYWQMGCESLPKPSLVSQSRLVANCPGRLGKSKVARQLLGAQVNDPSSRFRPASDIG